MIFRIIPRSSVTLIQFGLYATSIIYLPSFYCIMHQIYCFYIINYVDTAFMSSQQYGTLVTNDVFLTACDCTLGTTVQLQSERFGYSKYCRYHATR